jgi:hypothetical protein
VNDRTLPDNFLGSTMVGSSTIFYESANDVGCPFARDTRDTQNMITIAHGCDAVWFVGC